MIGGVDRIAFVRGWLKERYDTILEQPSLNGDVGWIVERTGRPSFELRLDSGVLDADLIDLDRWLETVADHARHRAPLPPNYYNVHAGGVRIRAARP